MRATGPHPSLYGPETVFAPAAAPRIVANASFDAALAGATASLAWVRFGDAAPCAACHVEAPVVADGAFHELAFDVAAAPAWAGAAALSRVIFQPLGAGGVDPAIYNRTLVYVASLAAAAA